MQQYSEADKLRVREKMLEASKELEAFAGEALSFFCCVLRGTQDEVSEMMTTNNATHLYNTVDNMVAVFSDALLDVATISSDKTESPGERGERFGLVVALSVIVRQMTVVVNNLLKEGRTEEAVREAEAFMHCFRRSGEILAYNFDQAVINKLLSLDSNADEQKNMEK